MYMGSWFLGIFEGAFFPAKTTRNSTRKTRKDKRARKLTKAAKTIRVQSLG